MCVCVCRFDELKDLVRVMRNSQRIRDVAKVQTGQPMASSALKLRLSLSVALCVTRVVEADQFLTKAAASTIFIASAGHVTSNQSQLPAAVT